MRKWMFRAALALMGAAVAGCGGGGTGGGGSFAIAVSWPTSRTIPELTQFIIVRVTGDGINQQQTISRPTGGSTSTSTAFAGLPIGQPLVIQANCYGQGTTSTAPLLGIAASQVTLNSQSGTTVTLTVQSTIDLLVFRGNDLSGGTLTLPPAGASNLTVSAYNTTNTIVPIGPGNLSFTSTGSGFTLAPSGSSVVVTAGNGAASGTITATEKESGVTATINVTIL